MSADTEMDLCYEGISEDTDESLQTMASNDSNQRGSGGSDRILILPPDNTPKRRSVSIVIIILAVIFICMVVFGVIGLILLSSDYSSQVPPTAVPDQGATVQPTKTPELQNMPDILSEGVKQLQDNNPDIALKSFEEGIQMNPRSLRGWTGKGYALIDLGRYEEAITAFNTALELNASYNDADVGRIIASEALGIRS